MKRNTIPNHCTTKHHCHCSVEECGIAVSRPFSSFVCRLFIYRQVQVAYLFTQKIRDIQDQTNTHYAARMSNGDGQKNYLLFRLSSYPSSPPLHQWRVFRVAHFWLRIMKFEV